MKDKITLFDSSGAVCMCCTKDVKQTACFIVDTAARSNLPVEVRERRIFLCVSCLSAAVAMLIGD